MSEVFGKFKGNNGAQIILNLRHIQAFEEGTGGDQGCTGLRLADGHLLYVEESIDEIWELFGPVMQETQQ